MNEQPTSSSKIPERCPQCGYPPSAGLDVCKQCGLPLKGEEIDRIIDITQRIYLLQSQFQHQLALLKQRQLRQSQSEQQSLRPSAAPGWPQGAPPAAGRQSGPVFTTSGKTGTTKPKQEWTTKRVQSLLLGIGSALVVMAALLFVAYAWTRLGLGGRTAIMAGVTAVTGISGYLAFRRSLKATAEALTTIMLILTLIDVGAAYVLGLWGVDAISGQIYWAAALTGLCALSTCYRLVVPQSATGYFALAVGQLPATLLLSASSLSSPLGWTVMLSVQVLLLVMLWRQMARFGLGVFAAISALITWPLLSLYVVVIALAGDSSASDLAIDLTDLAIVAVTAAGAAWLASSITQKLILPAAISALTAVAVGGLSIGIRAFDGEATWLVIGVTGLASTLLSWPLRGFTRRPQVVVGLTTTGLSLFGAVGTIAIILFGPLSWIGSIWDLTAGATTVDSIVPSQSWQASFDIVILLLVTASTFFAAGWISDRRLTGGMSAAVTCAVAVDLSLFCFELPYVVGVGMVTILAAVLVAGARSSAIPRTVGWVATAIGLFYAIQALFWSLASETTTLLVIGAWALVSIVIAYFDKRVRSSALLVGAVATMMWTVALTQVLNNPLALSGLVVILMAGVLAIVADRTKLIDPDLLLSTAALSGGVGILMSLGDAQWLELGFLASAAATAIVSLKPSRKSLVWLSASLLVFGLWTLLIDQSIEIVEVYTAPAALLTLAFGYFRRRADQTSSWAAYGIGLVLTFGPSVLLLATSESLVRPGSLGVVAIFTILYGTSKRLQAPLVLGSCALLLDAAVQFGPYVQHAPRWAAVGFVGALLLFLGATIERRRRDLQSLRQRYDALT